MAEEHHDPLELWVGRWTPEEWLMRENRKREQPAADMKVSKPQPQMEDTRKAE